MHAIRGDAIGWPSQTGSRTPELFDFVRAVGTCENGQGSTLERRNGEKQMDAMENLLTRRSCRAYKDEPVSDDAIYNIVRAGLYAPSGMGRQSAIVVVVTDKAVRDQLSRMNAEIAGMKEGDPFYGAPVVLVVLADRTVPTHVEDGALMMGNLLNAAHAEGLGSCWIHRAREEFESPEGKALLEKLGVKGDYVGIGHAILGVPAGAPGEAPAHREGRVFRI